jgi:hypothetical protein
MFRIDSALFFCSSTDMTPSPVLETPLPVEREVAAAVESQRALAAYLSTRFETHRITIFDEKNMVMRSSFPPPPCDYSSTSWLSWPTAMRSRSCPFTPS